MTLAEHLRPWRLAGVTHLLAEGGAPAAEEPARGRAFRDDSLTEGSAAGLERAGLSDASGDSAPRGEASGAFESHYKAPGASLPGRDAAPRPASSAQTTHGAEAEAASTGRGTAPRPEAIAQTAPRQATATPPADPLRWPEPWRSAFARTVPAPLLWTYPDLWSDLSGKGDPRRSSCLRAMIGGLGLPRGSSVFWPLCVEGQGGQENQPVPQAPPTEQREGELPEDRSYFQAGLRLLAPKALILFGLASVERAALALPLRLPFTQHVADGRLHILLPEFAVFLDEAPLTERACSYLRSALAAFPILFTR